MKQLQIQHAPNQGFLFMNLDQDAYAAYGDLSSNNPMVELVSRRDDIVLEIIENTNISDATISQAMALAFSNADVRLALDDIGAPDSMLSLPVLLAVNYLKLDRSWLAKRDAPAEMALLLSLIEFAHLQDKQLVLEGVETAADFQFAQEFNVDFVQGFMYRELFQNIKVN